MKQRIIALVMLVLLAMLIPWVMLFDLMFPNNIGGNNV